MSWFKRLFGIKDDPPAEAAPVPEEFAAVEEVAAVEPPVVPARPPDHFAIITTPAPEPVAEPQPTVESAVVVEEPEPEPVAVAPESEPEPAGEITVARLDEAEVLDALERALDELGSAHHRPFSRG